ncbi:MAG: dUTP diphosphatase [Dehalococcoidia bacterium]
MSDEAVVRVRLLRAGARVPERATLGASGFDVYACLEPGSFLEVGADPVKVPTGIAIEAPAGSDVQLRPRSGLAAAGVIATLGTLDADYRGEVFITLYTIGSRSAHRVEHGDRIAQLVVGRLTDTRLEATTSLSNSERGVGGHGSTGR